MEQAPRAPSRPLLVERPSDREGVRVDLLDRAQHGTSPVDRLDAPQIDLHQRLGVEPPGLHRHLHVDDGGLLDVEVRPKHADGGARSEERHHAQTGREHPAVPQEVPAGRARAASDITHDVPPSSPRRVRRGHDNIH